MSLVYGMSAIFDQLLNQLFGVMGLQALRALASEIEQWDANSGGRILPEEYWLLKEVGKRISDYISSPPVTSPVDVELNYFFVPENKMVSRSYFYIPPTNNCNPRGYTVHENKSPNNNDKNMSDKDLDPGTRMGFALNLADALKSLRFRLIPEGETI